MERARRSTRNQNPVYTKNLQIVSADPYADRFSKTNPAPPIPHPGSSRKRTRSQKNTEDVLTPMVTGNQNPVYTKNLQIVSVDPYTDRVSKTNPTPPIPHPGASRKRTRSQKNTETEDVLAPMVTRNRSKKAKAKAALQDLAIANTLKEVAEQFQEMEMDIGPDPLLLDGVAEPLLPEGVAEPMLPEGVAEAMLPEGIVEPMLPEGVAEQMLPEGIVEPMIRREFAEIPEGIVEPMLPVDPLLPDAGVDPLFPDAGVDPLFPDAGVDPLFPDAGVDPLFPDAGVDPLCPDAGVDPLLPGAAAEPFLPEAGLHAFIPGVVGGPWFQQRVVDPFLPGEVEGPSLAEAMPIINSPRFSPEDTPIEYGHDENFNWSSPIPSSSATFRSDQEDQSMFWYAFVGDANRPIVVRKPKPSKVRITANLDEYYRKLDTLK